MIETIVKMEMTEIMTVLSFLEKIIRRKEDNKNNNKIISTPEKNSYVCLYSIYIMLTS